MSNKNYLRDLFINEAKPALNRHSGSGGGGGSSRLIECESLPTENVDKDKIYLAERTEAVTHPGTFQHYYTGGDGSPPSLVFDSAVDDPYEVGGFIIVDNLDDLDHISATDLESYVLFYTVDGKMYMYDFDLETAVPACEAWDDGSVDLGYVNSIDEIDTSVESFAAIKTSPDYIEHVISREIGIPETDSIYKYRNGELKSVGLLKNVLKLVPDIFSYTEITSVQGVIGFTDTSDVKDLSDMFSDCFYLAEVPLFDTSNVKDMSGMFQNCTSLKEVPLFDTSKVTNMKWMFSGCELLKEVPLFDTSNVTNMYSMFGSCASLTTIPSLDVRNVSHGLYDGGFVYTFSYCMSLTECWLRNIKAPLQVGSGSSYGHQLTVESLIHLIYELRDTGSLLTFTIGNINLDKLANVYVRTVAVTDEMRSKDDLVDEKLPFVVCESTDEGAMLIKDYVNFKNWNLA